MQDKDILTAVALSKEADNYIEHYGTKRHSGRYPYGSGEDPYQHEDDFIGRVRDMQKDGLTESEIAEHFGMSQANLRKELSIAKNESKILKIEKAMSLRNKGYSNTAIAKEMGVNESTVRGWFSEEQQMNLNAARNLAQQLEDIVAEKGMIDVGKDVEIGLGTSRGKLDTALYMLEMKGYLVQSNRIENPTDPSKQTTQMVLAPPGTKPSDTYNYNDIHSVAEYTTSDDGGETFRTTVYPASIDSNRVSIRYSDDVGSDGFTGVQKDGLIELRPGVKDISLGGARYAQIRVLVDGTHYVKGMAVYSDDLPDGVDILVNSNKNDTGNKLDALKKISTDNPDNPFGSTIAPNGQNYYIDADGNKKLGVVNMMRMEDDWQGWSKDLPSQFLSKQSTKLARQQTNIAYDNMEAEFKDISDLTIPSVKKNMLMEFASECDSMAEHLNAAALPRQQYHVILPYNQLKDNEIYAPNYADGTKLALVRYPHGGIFEIPIVTVNNKNSDIKKQIGDASDAVGINSKVAAQLSGADFDGDTVMTIPITGNTKILSKAPLQGLVSFDPKHEYAMEKIDDSHWKSKTGRIKEELPESQKQKMMGIASNLITDMTIQGATDDELERAVKYSMVVIDAKKHHLDYKQAETDLNIKELKDKYQIKLDENGNPTGKSGGASTIISRAKSEVQVDKRQGQARINIKDGYLYDKSKAEGSVIYKTSSNLYYADGKTDKNTGLRTLVTIDNSGKKGKVTFDPKNEKDYAYYKPVQKKSADGSVYFTNSDGTILYSTKKRTDSSTQMAETNDARTLISADNGEMENIYADYANRLKALANKARLDAYNTGYPKKDKDAAERYSEAIKSLTAKLNRAKTNSPKERQAQRISASDIREWKKAHPNATTSETRKYAQQSLTKARAKVGAARQRIDISDSEWNAIKSNALSSTLINEILRYADKDIIREHAMPNGKKTISEAKGNRIASLNANGYTAKQIADVLDISVSSVRKYLKESEEP